MAANRNKEGIMGMAAFLCGGIAFLMSLIPGCTYLMMAPAAAGIFFGIAARITPEEPFRLRALAGIVLGGFAALLLTVWLAMHIAATIAGNNEAASLADTLPPLTQPSIHRK